MISGITITGKQLWTINVGMNIRAGAHDTQMSVYDFDGDGKASWGSKPRQAPRMDRRLSKEGPGGRRRQQQGLPRCSRYGLGGPEWFTIFDGATGAELDTIEYPVLYAHYANWGDSNGNRSHRYTGGFAFVKDAPAGGGAAVANGLPSAISGRGYYTYLTMSAMTSGMGVGEKLGLRQHYTDPQWRWRPLMHGRRCGRDGAQEIIPAQGRSTATEPSSVTREWAMAMPCT